MPQINSEVPKYFLFFLFLQPEHQSYLAVEFLFSFCFNGQNRKHWAFLTLAYLFTLLERSEKRRASIFVADCKDLKLYLNDA